MEIYGFIILRYVSVRKSVARLKVHLNVVHISGGTDILVCIWSERNLGGVLHEMLLFFVFPALDLCLERFRPRLIWG